MKEDASHAGAEWTPPEVRTVRWHPSGGADGEQAAVGQVA
jgi:hypothetical protein